MKTCYYVILYRPQGSKTWTPYDADGDMRCNFFASSLLALNHINNRIRIGGGTCLPGPGKTVPTEFNVGAVMIDSDEPVGVSMPHEVEKP